MSWFVNHDTPSYFDEHILEHGEYPILKTVAPRSYTVTSPLSICMHAESALHMQ